MDFNTGSSPEGAASSGGSSGGSGGAPPRMAATPGGEFDYRDPIQSFIRTAIAVITQPVGFFRGIQRQGDFINPLIFAVICAVISGLLSGILGFLIALVSNSGAGAAFGSLFGAIFIVPIATAIGLFIGAGIYYLLVMFLIKPNSGFEATFRVVAYASAVQLVSWLSAIPILGILIAIVVGLYSLYLVVMGIREVHATTTGRAAIVVLIPPIVLGILALIFGIVLVGIFAALSQQ
jgi:hypothetical protein